MLTDKLDIKEWVKIHLVHEEGRKVNWKEGRQGHESTELVLKRMNNPEQQEHGINGRKRVTVRLKRKFSARLQTFFEKLVNESNILL